MKVIYICGAIPEKLNDRLGQSVAGNKFSLNLAKNLDEILKGDLYFCSTYSLSESELIFCNREIWKGKPFFCFNRGKKFIISEIIQMHAVKKFLLKIRKTTNEPIAVIIENSPFAIAPICSALKHRLKLSCFSITIDTPFTKSFNANGIIGHINKWMFTKGQESLKNFDGLISFTKEIETKLHIQIPFHSLAIGCTTAQLKSIVKPQKIVENSFKSVYAGSLIYYNGIEQLLEAFSLLPSEYELHIYGYGPLEEQVKISANKLSNVFYHGRFSPQETDKILQQYDLLLNTRLLDPYIENFTFPSKLIDYILTGKSVLTSNFKTLPEPYKDFLFIIDDMSPHGIADAIINVFSENTNIRKRKAIQGINYISKYQNYSSIACDLIKFISQNM